MQELGAKRPMFHSLYTCAVTSTDLYLAIPLSTYYIILLPFHCCSKQELKKANFTNACIHAAFKMLTSNAYYRSRGWIHFFH